MKANMKIQMVICLTAFLGIATSCTDDFQELNTPPTLITEDMLQINGLLTYVQKQSVFQTPGFNRIGEFAGMMSNQASGYPFQTQDYGGFYDNFYRDYIININELVRLTSEDPKLSNKNAIAKIFRVWLWQNLTDRFGDIPFSQAGKPMTEIILQPAYETQESIYKQLFTDLKEATAQLSDDAEQLPYGNADLIYHGDVAAWERFANSLRLRMAIRVRYADAGLAQQNIDEVIDQPLITDNSQNAILMSEPSTSAIQGNRSPIVNALLNNPQPNEIVPGFPYMELLITKNDPRLGIYFNRSNTGIYRGRPVNLEGEEKNRYNQDSISYVGDYFRNSPFMFKIITAAEVDFLRAEAVVFGLASGDAQSLYADGIEQAMQMYGVDQSDIDTYLATSEGTLSGTDEEKLKQIIDQKYLSLFYQADEAWAEYRRTGYPLIWIGSGFTSTGGIIPRRLTYPEQEYVKNSQAVNQAASRMEGGDVLAGRVWWDAKPGLPFVHPRQGMFPPESW